MHVREKKIYEIWLKEVGCEERQNKNSIRNSQMAKKEALANAK